MRSEKRYKLNQIREVALVSFSGAKYGISDGGSSYTLSELRTALDGKYFVTDQFGSFKGLVLIPLNFKFK